nr:hypothetical protein OG781_32630 [Streptomyces sp. NBC_00830]
MSAIATVRMTALGDTGPSGVLSGAPLAILVNATLDLAGSLLAGTFPEPRSKRLAGGQRLL